MTIGPGSSFFYRHVVTDLWALLPAWTSCSFHQKLLVINVRLYVPAGDEPTPAAHVAPAVACCPYSYKEISPHINL